MGSPDLDFDLDLGGVTVGARGCRPKMRLVYLAATFRRKDCPIVSYRLSAPDSRRHKIGARYTRCSLGVDTVGTRQRIIRSTMFGATQRRA